MIAERRGKQESVRARASPRDCLAASKRDIIVVHILYRGIIISALASVRIALRVLYRGKRKLIARNNLRASRSSSRRTRANRCVSSSCTFRTHCTQVYIRVQGARYSQQFPPCAIHNGG